MIEWRPSKRFTRFPDRPFQGLFNNSVPTDAIGMTDHLQGARENIRLASDTADGEVQTNLNSLDEGLGDLTEEGKTSTGEPADEADRFEELEEKLRGLIDETDGETETALQDARDELDAYRRERDLA